MNTIISRSYRRAVGTGNEFLLSAWIDFPCHYYLSNERTSASDTISLDGGRRGYWTLRVPSLPRQVTPSFDLKRAQHYFRPTILPAVFPLKFLECRTPNAIIASRSTHGVALQSCGGDNLMPKRTSDNERRWLSKGPSTEEGHTENDISVEDQSGKVIIDTKPLNHQATKAIISQLSSPPNLLTLTRIIATPYLSYMLISYNRKSNITSCTIEGETLAALYSSAPPVETAINSTIDISADAAPTIFANLDQLSTPEAALLLFLLMGFTDFLDGHIARAYPSTATVLGTYLDPIADKFFISILSLTLWYIGSLPGPLVGLWIARDVEIVGSVYWLVRKETIRIQRSKRLNENDSDSNNVAIMDPQNTPLKVQASFTSKVNTTLQIGLIALGIAGEVPSIEIPPLLMTSLIWITAGTTIGSSLGYLDGSAMKNTGKK